MALRLILKAMYKVFPGKSIGWLTLIAQQIADGVIVLAVCQATNGERLKTPLVGSLDDCVSSQLLGIRQVR